MLKSSTSSMPKRRLVLVPTTEGRLSREKITEVVLRDLLKLLSRENRSLKRQLAVAKQRIAEFEDRHP